MAVQGPGFVMMAADCSSARSILVFNQDEDKVSAGKIARATTGGAGRRRRRRRRRRERLFAQHFTNMYLASCLAYFSQLFPLDEMKLLGQSGPQCGK